MTTRFDSFDSSRGRGFVDSGKQGRNTKIRLGVLLMVIIDEAEGPYVTETGSLWEGDLNEFFATELRLERNHSVSVKTLLFQPQITDPKGIVRDEDSLNPPGQGVGRFFPIPVGRPGNLFQYSTPFSGLMRAQGAFVFSLRQSVLLVQVDDSGSMIRNDVLPTLNEFFAFARGSTWPNLFVQDLGKIHPEERWLRTYTQMLEWAERNFLSDDGG